MKKEIKDSVLNKDMKHHLTNKMQKVRTFLSSSHSRVRSRRTKRLCFKSKFYKNLFRRFSYNEPFKWKEACKVT